MQYKMIQASEALFCICNYLEKQEEIRESSDL